MNLRVPFATERVMRTIIDQMREARIVFGVNVSLGERRTQVVQCFVTKDGRGEQADVTLERMYRLTEAADPTPPILSGPWGHPTISTEEVPH
jgi:hypothetical protein